MNMADQVRPIRHAPLDRPPIVRHQTVGTDGPQEFSESAAITECFALANFETEKLNVEIGFQPGCAVVHIVHGRYDMAIATAEVVGDLREADLRPANRKCREDAEKGP